MRPLDLRSTAPVPAHSPVSVSPSRSRAKKFRGTAKVKKAGEVRRPLVLSPRDSSLTSSPSCAILCAFAGQEEVEGSTCCSWCNERSWSVVLLLHTLAARARLAR